MNREELSRPPSDADMLTRIIDDAIQRTAVGGIVSLAVLMREVAPQLPQAISWERLAQAISSSAMLRGVVLDIDGR